MREAERQVQSGAMGQTQASRAAVACVAWVGSLLLGSVASAQTSDGIGGRTESTLEGQTAEEAAEQIDELIDLYDYETRFYQVSARVHAVHVPRFILDIPFALHTNTWGDGPNLAYGLSFTTRIPEKFDVVASLDYTDLSTPSGYWLEDGDPVRDADYTESNLSLIGADVALNWFKSLDRKETVQVFGGFGLGLAVVLGAMDKSDIDAQACGWDTVEERAETDPALVEQCAEDFGSPRSPFSEEEDRIPPVAPLVSVGGGFRFLFADHVALALEGGLKSGYFYAGLNVGYFWNAMR